MYEFGQGVARDLEKAVASYRTGCDAGDGRACSDLGIPTLTVYGFSTENWRRDSTEISLLLDLCVYFAQNELIELSRAVSVRGASETRLAYARALDGVWAAPCDTTHLYGRCHHRIALPRASTLFKPSLHDNSDPPLSFATFHMLVALFIVELCSSK